MASPQNYLAVIKVVGIGGGGVNAINRMIDVGLKGVEFIAINTDAQHLLMSDADVKLDIGRKSTKGLGAGAAPEKGREAALDHADEIEEIFEVEEILDFAYDQPTVTRRVHLPFQPFDINFRKMLFQKTGLYKIKWQNYDDSHNSWEPLSNLDCEDKLKAFYVKRLSDREKATPSR